MEIVLIILGSLCLIALVAIIILLFVFKPNKEMKNDELKEILSLNAKLESINESVKNSIEAAILKEIGKMNKEALDNNELNNAKLERFQNAISKSINDRFDALNKQMEDKINSIDKKVDDRLTEGFKNTNESMTQVRERLQAIDVAQKNIQDLSKDVVSLKQVLDGNQSRGQYGEYQLSMVLHNVFGDTLGCYEEQYTLKKVKDGDNVRADAVVFMPEPNKMICIDSKFPFKDYARLFEANSDEEKEQLTKDFANAVKNHITAIKDKYIVDGKTAPQAIMFVPNDGVFAFIFHNCDKVVQYAREKSVVLTSPSTLPAILMTINMVRIQIERAKNANEITKQLTKLSKDFKYFGIEWNKFSNALESTSRNKEKLNKRVNSITLHFDNIKDNDVLELDDTKEVTSLPEIDEKDDYDLE